jgi:hypothetical protein
LLPIWVKSATFGNNPETFLMIEQLEQHSTTKAEIERIFRTSGRASSNLFSSGGYQFFEKWLAGQNLALPMDERRHG